jgi:hypothetical protein
MCWYENDICFKREKGQGRWSAEEEGSSASRKAQCTTMISNLLHATDFLQINGCMSKMIPVSPDYPDHGALQEGAG